MDDDYEHVLLVVRECFVYKIPPRSPNGYKAADWNVNDFLWTGRLKIISRGEKCAIMLEDTNSGEVFATCPYVSGSVEPVTDSGRYFVLRIDDGKGRHAFIGMGFQERADAFDFNVALQDHKKYIQQKKDAVELEKQYQNEPKKDYSLGSGQTIHVDLKNKIKAVPVNTPTPKPTPAAGASGGLLPPPPAAGSRHRTPAGGNSAAVTAPTPTQPAKQSFDWSEFAAAPTTQPQAPKTNSAANWHPFG